jgi:hypothetical protein
MMRIVLLGLCLIATTSVAAAQPSSTAVAPACGSAPAEALSYTLKGAALSRRSTARAPADLFVAVPDSLLRPVEDSRVCLELMMRITLVEADAGDRPMVGVVRVGDAGHTVVLAPAPGDAEREGWINLYQLDFDGVLRMKRTINLVALGLASCGASPARGQASMLGILEALRTKEPTGSIYDQYLIVPTTSITPVTDEAECGRMAAVVALSVTAGDTLPMLGIVRMGEIGFVVIRGTPPVGYGTHGSFSQTFLTPERRVASHHHFTY